VVKVSGEAVRISGETVVTTVSGSVTRISGETIYTYTPTVVKTGPIRVITGASGGEVLHSGAVKSTVVKALTGNSGLICVGGVTNRPWYEDTCSGEGLVLDAGEAVSMDVHDFADIYVVAEVSGDQVSFIGVN